MRVHKPVMLKEALEFLVPEPGRRFLDATAGAGQHCRAVLERIVPGGLIVGLDRDEDMLALARRYLNQTELPEEAWRLFHLSYRDLDQAAEKAGLSEKGFDGILFDLGVASPQIDQPGRGFSFQKDGPLDFRFDKSQSLTGYEVINRWPEKEILCIFYEYGDIRKPGAMAGRICRMRAKQPIETTAQLAQVIRKGIPPKRRTTRRDPATVYFQAIRIAVNKELEHLSRGIQLALEYLAPKGVCVALSYHSGEDRIVKRAFASASRRGDKKDREFELLTKKPVYPTEEEIRENPRARSARLRAIRRRRPYRKSDKEDLNRIPLPGFPKEARR